MDTSDEEFFREARSQIRSLNDGLLAVENDDEVAVDELFRVAHSLKGSCRVQGLREAGELAHALEDLLGALRGGEVEPAPSLIDEALDAVDLLEATVRTAANGGETGRDIDAVRASLRSTLEEHRAQTKPVDSEPGSLPEGKSDDGWKPSDDDLNDDVVAALEDTTEFDDIGSLLDDQSERANDDDGLEGWGLLDEDTSTDGTTVPENEEQAETPDDPAVFFEETKDEFDDGGEIDSLQEDIDSVEFGEFDDDDDYTIDELIDLEPDETTPAAGGTPVEEDSDEESRMGADGSVSEDDASDTRTAVESVDSLIESESVSGDSPETADGESVEPASDGSLSVESGTDHAIDVEASLTEASEPVESGGTKKSDGSPATSDADRSDEAHEASTFVFGQNTEDDTSSQVDDSDESGPAGVPETDPSLDGESTEGSDGESTEGREDGDESIDSSEPTPDLDDVSVSDSVESPPLPEAEVPDSDSVPDTDLDIDLSEDLDADPGDDWENESRMDVSIDDGMAEFESRFDDLLGEESTQESEHGEGPTFQAAVPTIEESRLDADTFPAGEDGDEEGDLGEFDRLQTMTVDVDTADQLLSVAEELSLTHLRLDEAVGSDTDDAIRDEVANLLSVITEYRRTVMDVRLMPLKTAVETIPRTVRDIARSQDKDVELVVDDMDVELDRGIINKLKDPLVHIARNAIDHGIEDPDDRIAAGKPSEGTVEIRAERDGDEVTIEVADDGRGIEPEAVRQRAVDRGILTQEEARELADEETYDLLFEPGFTTREEVTDVSGRGVGMDVVGRTVTDLNGSVTVDSEPGEGTTVRLTVPVSIVFTEVLFVEVDGQTFGIPMSVVEQITAVPPVRAVDGREVVQRSDLDLVGGLPDGVEAEDSYPLVRLESALDLTRSDTDAPDDGQIVWVRAEAERLAIRCDRVVTSREVVVRPYGDVLRDVPGVSGATTVGDGEAVNVLDVGTI